MVRPVVQGLRQADADRRVGLGSVIAMPLQDGVRVGIVRQDLRPGGAVTLHGGPELSEVHVVFVDDGGMPATHDEQVTGVRSDGVAHRVQDGPVRPGDGRLQLFRFEREAHIHQCQGRPHMMREARVVHQCLLMRTR
jgi:hypothetical protein